MLIRTARESDLPDLLSIYNYEILNGTATFDTEPLTPDERKPWLLAHNVENHPLIVSEEDGRVTGYASLSSFNPKPAYRGTVELSIYVAPDQRGKGTGRALFDEIMRIAREDRTTSLVVSIITGTNESSIRLHEKSGFTRAGILHGAGFKFGKTLDVVYYECRV